ncbi:glycoside hydrolase family 76 [Lecanosticta acicola]|uniref:Glycoside hydrolase family 76 n=1 Tax=Lecanosticta acicola TaxID=111012 RepID=A0AAI8YYK9_9PEZI|nr:glycoside hydrolase family 76 [Lecanosticta acicola]
MLSKFGLPISLALNVATAYSSSSCAERILNATGVLNDRWYDPQVGLWERLWWDSGAILTTIANVALVCDDFRPTAMQMFSQILDNARAANGGSYLDGYYDDEGWWSTGLIKAYDVSGDPKYLDEAAKIYNDFQTGNDPTCGGGIFWSKTQDEPYPAAIANELFLATAASLANRIPDNSTYRDQAQKQLDWFLSTNLINPDFTVNDGLNISNCSQPRGSIFTYNQGVILGGLVEMHNLTSNATYLSIASSIAHATIDQLATPFHGILNEPHYLINASVIGNYDSQDGYAFKGIFARNLMDLHVAAPEQAFYDFLQKNADSIWNSDRQGDGQLGALWQGPVVGLSAASHGSALDCLVAAARVREARLEASSSSSIRTLAAIPTPTPRILSTPTPTTMSTPVFCSSCIDISTAVVVVTATVTSKNG